MKLEVHILVNDADWVTPWTLRHYCSFADKVWCHDGGPDWSERSVTQELCRCHGAEWRPWDTAGELNDDLAAKLKNSCWRGTDSDWVICADADELIYFPPSRVAPLSSNNAPAHKNRAQKVLEEYDRLGAAVIKPHGYEMFSNFPPPMGEHNQIWQAVPDGAPDDEWYSKPILFSPRLVSDSGFGIGAHESRPVLRDGRVLRVSRTFPKASAATYLLHYHQIGAAAEVAERYDATRRRLSQINFRSGWGNFAPGKDHVAEKRAKILPNLRRVVL